MPFLFILFIVLFLILKYAGKEIWQKVAYQTALRKSLITIGEREEIRFYLKNISYYQNLSPAGKQKFEDRLFVFMLNKEFIGRNGLDVTEEMRVQISASAIQLTFGLNDYKLETLESIYIHPDIFKLGLRSPEYKGATSGHMMHLSWKSFQEGYQISDDNLNLGLHEMTHALKLTLYLGKRFDVVFAGRMEHWEELMDETYETLRTKPNFLRSYSKANTEEFFAVCVEAYFESPEKFKKELPEIYQSLVFLLNQDILNKGRDYQISEGYFTGNSYDIPHPDDVKTSYKYSSYHWSVTMLVIGVLGFLPAVGLAHSYFLFPVQLIFLLGLVFGTIGLFQKKYFYDRKIFSGIYFLFYAYFGFGAVATILCVVLNFAIPISKTYEEKFTIGGPKHFNHVSLKPDSGLESGVNESDFLFPNKYGRRKYLVVKYHYGILGVRKVDDFFYTDKE